MVKIEAFRGLVLSQKYRPVADKLVCPIYDQIPKEEVGQYKRKSPYNLVRYELPEKRSAIKAFRKALFGKKIYAQSDAPSLYIYEIEYTDPFGERKSVYSLLALAEIGQRQSFSRREHIFEHENVFTEKMVQRFEIMREGQMFLNPVSGLIVHESSKNFYGDFFRSAVSGVEPLYSIIFRNERHRIWEIKDVQIIMKIREMLRNEKILIADGHHRYGASELLCNEGILNKAMMMLTDMNDPGIAFLGRQRLVNLDLRMILELTRNGSEDGTKYELIDLPSIKKLKELFRLVTTYADDLNEINTKLQRVGIEGSFAKEGHGLHFGVYYSGKASVLRVILPAELLALHVEERMRSSVMADFGFDVYEILHNTIIDHFRATEKDDRANPPTIDEAVSLVNNKTFKMALFLPVIGEDLIQLVCQRAIVQGKKVRQKSTCILPKPLSGMVIYYFRSLQEVKEFKELVKAARGYKAFLKGHDLYRRGGKLSLRITQHAEEMHLRVVNLIKDLEQLGFSYKLIIDTLKTDYKISADNILFVVGEFAEEIRHESGRSSGEEE